MSLKRDIELLFEIGTFRHLDRVWKQFLDPSVANNTEHTFRVAWIALTIARYEKTGDHEKILKMALLHDLDETRCGDVHYLSRQYVVRKTKEAIEDIFAETVHSEEMKGLFDEYEKRESVESKIVKDADNVDVEFELREQRAKGHSIGDILQKDRDAMLYPKLFTATAKKLWDEIKKSDPHDWHLTSPKNRFRGGDWKTK